MLRFYKVWMWVSELNGVKFHKRGMGTGSNLERGAGPSQLGSFCCL